MAKTLGPTPQQLARHLLMVRAASEGFLAFVKFMQPDWKLAPFQVELIETLDALEKEELFSDDGTPIDNVLVTMPPRMAKSTFCTIFFPAYFMARDPSRFIMSCSYNSQLATDFGRNVRDIVEDPRLTQVFPDFKLSTESRAADVWATEDRGKYFAVGIGGTTSGRPANLLILDDPIKARDDAESMTQRNKTWNYYTSALNMRLQPDNNGRRPKTVIVLTRWHPDDVAGRLMRSDDWKEGRWKHVNFQGIQTKRSKPIPVNKLPKDHPAYHPGPLSKLTEGKRTYVKETEVSIWPERFPLDVLERRRRLNPREFTALYQQQPYIEGGNLIKTEWWQYYPSDLKPERFASLVIAADTAFKKNEMADYSVAVVAGLDRTGDIYLIDVVRGRFEFPELKQRLIRLNNQWRGKGLRALYVEDKASGQSIIQELKRQSGMSVIPYKVSHDKVARVNSIIGLIEGGRVFLPDEAPWLDAFVDEAVSFPGGTHDDQVDAMCIALDVLSKTGLTPDAYDLMTNIDQSLNNLNHETSFGKSLTQSLDPSRSKWGGWGTL